MRHGTSRKAKTPPDERFTKTLVVDVGDVLERHGYARLTGPQRVELSAHLMHLLHGDPTGACQGQTR